MRRARYSPLIARSSHSNDRGGVELLHERVGVVCPRQGNHDGFEAVGSAWKTLPSRKQASARKLAARGCLAMCKVEVVEIANNQAEVRGRHKSLRKQTRF